MKAKEQGKSPTGLKTRPWMSPLRYGGVSIISIGMMVLAATQLIPEKGWPVGILWGVGYGAIIWIMFFGLILVGRLLHR